MQYTKLLSMQLDTIEAIYAEQKHAKDEQSCSVHLHSSGAKPQFSEQPPHILLQPIIHHGNLSVHAKHLALQGEHVVVGGLLGDNILSWNHPQITSSQACPWGEAA